MAYAKATKVSVDKSISEMRKILDKAGTSGFAYSEFNGVVSLMFIHDQRGVKMMLRIAKAPSKEANAASLKTYEQLRRSKFRSLLLCIKAKVESVESGIETFEEAFLPHLVLKNGHTVGQKVIGQVDRFDSGDTKFLLGM